MRYEGPVWSRIPFPSLRFEGIRAGEGEEHRFSPHRLFREFLLPLEPEGESVNCKSHPALRRNRVGGPNRLQALFSEAGSTTRAGAPPEQPGKNIWAPSHGRARPMPPSNRVLWIIRIPDRRKSDQPSGGADHPRFRGDGLEGEEFIPFFLRRPSPEPRGDPPHRLSPIDSRR